jgi:hypothetical protein
VEVYYDEGLANHIGPEPCSSAREDGTEASAGERAGEVLSRERFVWGADAVDPAEGNTGRSAKASCGLALRGPRPSHARKLLAWKPGDLAVGHGSGPRWKGEEP